MLYCLAKKILFKSIFLFQKTPENFIPKVIFIPITTGIGNLILKTTSFRIIKQNYPKCKIILYCDYPNKNYKILENSPYIDKIIINKNTFSFFKYIKQFLELRKLNIDTVILPFDVSMNYFYFFLMIIRPNKRIGHIYKIDGPEHFLFNIKVEFDDETHEIDLNINLIKSFSNINIKDKYKTEIFFKDKNNEEYDDFIAIQVGAANGIDSLKILPSKNFIILIRDILKLYPKYKIMLIGNRQEKKKGIYISEKVNDKRVINKFDQNLKQISIFLKKASLVICHDSGIMHISNALNIPLIALYGATNIKRTKPLGKTLILSKVIIIVILKLGSIVILKKIIQSVKWKRNRLFQKLIMIKY